MRRAAVWQVSGDRAPAEHRTSGLPYAGRPTAYRCDGATGGQLRTGRRCAGGQASVRRTTVGGAPGGPAHAWASVRRAPAVRRAGGRQCDGRPTAHRGASDGAPGNGRRCGRCQAVARQRNTARPSRRTTSGLLHAGPAGDSATDGRPRTGRHCAGSQAAVRPVSGDGAPAEHRTPGPPYDGRPIARRATDDGAAGDGRRYAGCQATVRRAAERTSGSPCGGWSAARPVGRPPYGRVIAGRLARLSLDRAMATAHPEPHGEM